MKRRPGLTLTILQFDIQVFGIYEVVELFLVYLGHEGRANGLVQCLLIVLTLPAHETFAGEKFD